MRFLHRQSASIISTVLAEKLTLTKVLSELGTIIEITTPDAIDVLLRSSETLWGLSMDCHLVLSARPLIKHLSLANAVDA